MKIFIITKLVALIVVYYLIGLNGMFDDWWLHVTTLVATGQDHYYLMAVIFFVINQDCRLSCSGDMIYPNETTQRFASLWFVLVIILICFRIYSVVLGQPHVSSSSEKHFTQIHWLSLRVAVINIGKVKYVWLPSFAVAIRIVWEGYVLNNFIYFFTWMIEMFMLIKHMHI